MRKGSLEFWPHRRAKRQMPRVRSWPTAAEQGFPGFVAFKAGMTHITMIDDTESPAKGTEVSRAVTIVEFPKVYLYGVRAYRKGYVYTEADSEVYDATLAKRVGINKTERTDINALKGKAEEYEKQPHHLRQQWRVALPKKGEVRASCKIVIRKADGGI